MSTPTLFMPEYDHSVEILLHLRCKPCNGWWTIGDGKPDRNYFCTYCGKELKPAQYPDFPPKTIPLTPGELPL